MEISSFIQSLEPVHIDANVYDIMQSFHEHKNLSFVPIVNQFDEPLGIVREQSMRDFTFTIFGHELLKRKLISDFLSPCPMVSFSTNFVELIQTPTFQHREEGFIIIKEGVYAGFLTVSSLLEMYEMNRVDTQQQLFQAQKMESIGNLAGGIAHDFNNILGSITGYLALAKMKLPPQTETVKNDLDTIETLAFRAANLTKQLLGFARGGKYEVLPLNVNEVAKHVITITRHTFNRSIAIREDLCPSLHIIKADRGQLEQVVMNLVINSRDAMPEGGTITIRTWNFDASEKTDSDLLNSFHNGGIGISVQDTGEGIPPENLKRVFEPFFTTKEKGKGTGMGLAMVYGIVRNHEGQIEVKSDVGKGTTISMYFPASLQSDILPLEVRMSTTKVDAVKQATVIVVDDDLDMLSVISNYLEQKGCSVIAFSDGNLALEYFRVQSDTIDLVLLDMIMPHISGQEVFHELRQTDPDIKVIFMSGYNDSKNVQELLSHERTAFIQKPFMFNELSMIMYRIMASHIVHVQQQ